MVHEAGILNRSAAWRHTGLFWSSHPAPLASCSSAQKGGHTSVTCLLLSWGLLAQGLTDKARGAQEASSFRFIFKQW